MAREKLTPKQAAFASAYLETGSATEAYRRAYDTSRTTSGAIEVEGKRLLKHPLITLRLRAAQERVAAKAEVTAAKILDELREAWALARDRGQPSAMVAASMGRAKVAGLIAEKKDVEQPSGSMTCRMRSWRSLSVPTRPMSWKGLTSATRRP